MKLVKKFNELKFKQKSIIINMRDAIKEIDGEYLNGAHAKEQVKNLRTCTIEYIDECLYSKYHSIYGSGIIQLYGCLTALKWLINSQKFNTREKRLLQQDDTTRVQNLIDFINQNCIFETEVAH